MVRLLDVFSLSAIRAARGVRSGLWAGVEIDAIGELEGRLRSVHLDAYLGTRASRIAAIHAVLERRNS
jgi:hypothetical protein